MYRLTGQNQESGQPNRQGYPPISGFAGKQGQNTLPVTLEGKWLNGPDTAEDNLVEGGCTACGTRSKREHDE